MLKRLLTTLLVILFTTTTADAFYSYRFRTHETDCTSITDGRERDLCFEEDSNRLFKCLPTGGADVICDSAGEWKNITVDAASTTASGIVELATAAEMDTATDTERALGVNEFNDSDWGARTVFIVILDDTVDTAVADGEGDFEWVPGDIFAGYNIVDIECGVYVAGTTGTTDIQLHNVTSAADVLSTKCTIDSGETSSHTAEAPAVIDTGEDDITSADRYRFDFDAISTTAAKGAWIELTLRKP